MQWKIIDKVLDSMAGICLLIMSGSLAVQIVYRYILNSPLFWPLPVSLYFFVWMVWLGGAAGMRDERQMRMELAERNLPQTIRRFLEPAKTLTALGLLILIVYKSFEVVEIQGDAIYDTFPVSRSVLFIVAPIMGSVMVIFHLRLLYRQLHRHFYRTRKRKE